MTSFRVTIAARAFCVSAILGLSLSLSDVVAVQGTLLLAAIAAIASGLEVSYQVTDRAVVYAEGGLAALVVGLTLPEGGLILPYLVVPALVAGVRQGVLAVLVTVSAELIALLAVVVPAATLGVETLAKVLAPWLLTTVGVGLAFARVRFTRFSSDDASEAYEQTIRLLSQLRTVARRLPSGLDSIAIANEMLHGIHDHFGDTCSAVFVRAEGGTWSPLSFRGAGARTFLDPGGDLVERCWTEMRAVTTPQTAGDASRRHRCVLPLRVGTRMIGVVVFDGPTSPPQGRLESASADLDQHALRIEAAVAFDEIRSIATMEERHRLAREIHDGVAQEVASLGYIVDDLAASTTSAGQLRKLASLRSELTRVVSELRLSIFDLRSELSAGLGSALSEYVREVGARSGLTVHLSLDVSPSRLRAEVETELLRIAQEAVTNARKHSGAQNLWVDCRIKPPFAQLSIADDGVGMGSARSDSYGLEIMRERSRRIGASLEVGANEGLNSGVGTKVTITVGAEVRADVVSRR